MEDLTFIDQLAGDCGASNATLKTVDPEGRVSLISDCVSPYRLLDNCPLLYHAFEHGSQSRLQASIEAPSRVAAIALLRYCYTGSYLPPCACAEDAPILLLLHAHVYKMAEDYDVPELQLLAHGNFSVQVECACSLPLPPQDLLETIRYVYANFASPQARQQQGLIHTLLNYCISVFLYHQLGESMEFLQVVQQIPELRQDLCRTNMDRNFQDDCAFDIIHLALNTLQPQSSIRPTLLASRDLPEAMLFDRPKTPPRPIKVFSLRPKMENTERRYYDTYRDPAPHYNTTDEEDVPRRYYDTDEDLARRYWATSETPMRPVSPISTATTLVHRPREPIADTGFVTESASEDEGFSIIRQPKPPVNPSMDEPMSSPEIIPAKPIDVLAATGSNYPDDDDWTML
ncbi:hypothetical protein HBH56_041650 [Parastagonospora nodorum]|uniref:BTB domain-containing protein n=1 Tax=Phaeosphaeria nodorum (strain SN15 / ATCC MYA-4574 / FGSC 10173) TaxID=321614 RepID=A0A7U2ETW4_PHANO|nr:hypothetical protein HBH56_041650 [Parastagonospora nodorum]QRC92995.1 hypothetical protein JI435_079580 [Parastagonospora nodorum SN15]KAH3932917.1 hypothetical protein HBH54_069400 [Parastagonospora nodorum]KAH4004364.1 hypothetical protein HBI10_048440 [Parastagonospora nodorum]KAH4018596.1 hypothetical protein HBI13_134670 [Parastagonospora nodorum]